MGNGEWGMGDKKEKFPSSSLSLRLHPLSQLPTPHSQLPTPQPTTDDKTLRRCYRRLFGDRFRGWKTGGV